MLCRRRRRQTGIETALGQCLLFAGNDQQFKGFTTMFTSRVLVICSDPEVERSLCIQTIEVGWHHIQDSIPLSTKLIYMYANTRST